jgi:hypothetical protein
MIHNKNKKKDQLTVNINKIHNKFQKLIIMIQKTV